MLNCKLLNWYETLFKLGMKNSKTELLVICITTAKKWRTIDFFNSLLLKFIYSEKASKFCEIFTLLLTTVHTVKSMVAFSEYMNFTYKTVVKLLATLPNLRNSCFLTSGNIVSQGALSAPKSRIHKTMICVSNYYRWFVY